MSLSNMLSKLKSLGVLRNFSPRTTRVYIHYAHSVTGSPRFFCNSACQINDSDAINEAPESPELPPWAKFHEDEHQSLADSDDDTLFSAIAPTVQSQELPDLVRAVTAIPIDSTVSDAARISKTLKKGFSRPEAAAQALIGCDVTASESLVEHLLKRFRYDWVLALGVFNWAKSQTGYLHSSNSYLTIIDVLGKGKQFDAMLEVVKEMENVWKTCPLTTLSNMISVLSNANRWTEAIDSFRDAERIGITMDITLLNILLSCLVRKADGVKYAEDVFLEFKDQIPPDVSTYNTLIKGWCKARKLDVSQKTTEKLDSYISLGLADSRVKPLNLESILEEMHKNGCPPNPITYTHVIHFLGHGNIEEALNQFEKMKQTGCNPDTICYDTMITLLLNAGRVPEARALFEDMKMQGFQPEGSTYAAFMTHFCKELQEENAAEILKEMDGNSCQPNHHTYIELLTMCCRKKRMKTVYYLLGHMLKNNMSIEMKVYLAVIRELCSNGKLDHACLFAEHGMMRGWFLPSSVYKRLIEKLEEKKMERAIEMIQELMVQPGSEPLLKMYKLLKKCASRLQVGTGLIVQTGN